MSAVDDAAAMLDAHRIGKPWYTPGHGWFVACRCGAGLAKADATRHVAEALAEAGYLRDGTTRTERGYWDDDAACILPITAAPRSVLHGDARPRCHTRKVTEYPPLIGPWTEVSP